MGMRLGRVVVGISFTGAPILGLFATLKAQGIEFTTAEQVTWLVVALIASGVVGASWFTRLPTVTREAAPSQRGGRGPTGVGTSNRDSRSGDAHLLKILMQPSRGQRDPDEFWVDQGMRVVEHAIRWRLIVAVVVVLASSWTPVYFWKSWVAAAIAAVVSMVVLVYAVAIYVWVIALGPLAALAGYSPPQMGSSLSPAPLSADRKDRLADE